jgi:hypothetical protein
MDHPLLAIKPLWKPLEWDEKRRKWLPLTSHQKYAIMSVYHVEDHRLPAVFFSSSGKAPCVLDNVVCMHIEAWKGTI